jgi:hypothetical protein
LLVGVGFIAGVVLNVIKNQRTDDYVPWTDPVVLASALMLGWLVAAAVFNWTYPAARHGRKVAYLTVASLLFLAVVLGTFLFGNSEHNPTPHAARQTGRPGGGV